MSNLWASDWEEKWEDEHERMMEMNHLATELFLIFDAHELVDSELADFLGSMVNHFFGELIASKYSSNMIRSVFEHFVKRLSLSINDALETRGVIEAYENS